MKVYCCHDSLILEKDGAFRRSRLAGIDSLLTCGDPAAWVREVLLGAAVLETSLWENESPLAPIGRQEIWAAGVTYFRSRDARMEESETAGGGDFYDRVYAAKRPELFFKGTPSRVAGPGQKVRIRGDSKWNVPEPELTLALSKEGKLIGYTLGNDMSSRDIEGENPLYLPQAKVYWRSAAIGPCILIAEEPLPKETEIRMEIHRDAEKVFSGATSLAEIKRSFSELAEYLFREDRFPFGCFLMTGTGIVPPSDFKLKSGDRVDITVDAIGTLSNEVE